MSEGCGRAFVSDGYDIPNICGGDIGSEYCPYCNPKAKARKHPKWDKKISAENLKC